MPAPHLSDDAYTTTVDTPLNVPAPGVRTNDEPIPAGTEVRATPAAHGGAMLATSGLLYYVPDSGYTGTDSLTYCFAQVGAGACFTNTATVRITVTVSSPPTTSPPTTAPPTTAPPTTASPTTAPPATAPPTAAPPPSAPPTTAPLSASPSVTTSPTTTAGAPAPAVGGAQTSGSAPAAAAPSTSPAPTALARTGAGTMRLALTGLVLLLTGLFALDAKRRLRRHA